MSQYEAVPAHALRQHVVNNRTCLKSLESVSNGSRIASLQQFKKKVEDISFPIWLWVVDHHVVYDRGDTYVHHDSDDAKEK